MVPRKATKFENSLWRIAAKLESAGTNFFLQTIDQESCRWNRIYQTLIPTFWIVIPSCFLSKIAQTVQKVIIFFPDRGEEIEPWFWHIWISREAKGFSALLLIFFDFGHPQGKRGVRIGPKVLTLDMSLFYENSNPLKKFQTTFLFSRILTLVRVSVKSEHIWRSKSSKTSLKALFHWSWKLKLVRKTLKIYNLTITNAILMKRTTIMYLYESANRKPLRARNSFL